jgi:hypothetical protein
MLAILDCHQGGADDAGHEKTVFLGVSRVDKALVSSNDHGLGMMIRNNGAGLVAQSNMPNVKIAIGQGLP